ARLSDSLTFALDVSRIHWSDFRLQTSRQQDVLLVENGAPSGKGKAVLQGASDDTTTARLGVEYIWFRRQAQQLIPFRAGFFYDPEPGNRGTDPFFGFSLGTGIAFPNVVFDVAYTYRRGTVHSEATSTAVANHGFLASIIYYFRSAQ